MNRNLLFAAVTSGSDVLVFVLMVIAGRWLGAEDFGAFSYIQALATVGLTMMGFGLEALIIRELSKDPSKGPEYLFVMVMWKVPVGLVSILVLCLVGDVWLDMSSEHFAALCLMSAALFIRNLAMGIRVLLRPFDRYDVEARTALVEQMALLVFGSTALLGGWGLLGLSVAYVGARAIGLVVTLRPVTEIIPLSWLPNLRLAVNLQRMAVPVGISLFLSNTYVQVDTFLIKAMSDYWQVGLYNVPFKIYMAMNVFSAIISSVLLPRLSRTALVAEGEHMRMVVLGVGISLLAGVPVAVLGISFSEQLIVGVFGEAYMASVKTMQILFVSVAISIQVSFVRTLLISVNQQAGLLKISILALCFRFILGLLFIRSWGIEGAATSVVVSELLVCAAGWAHLMKRVFQDEGGRKLWSKMRRMGSRANLRVKSALGTMDE